MFDLKTQKIEKDKGARIKMPDFIKTFFDLKGE